MAKKSASEVVDEEIKILEKELEKAKEEKKAWREKMIESDAAHNQAAANVFAIEKKIEALSGMKGKL
jgi:septal ring factor EnvC (AmiA/AmiB activator)